MSFDDLYALEPGYLQPLGADECVYIAVDDGKAHVMTAEVGEQLPAMRNFATLAEHATGLVTRIPRFGGRLDVARAFVGQLAQIGLLRSAHRQLELLNQGTRQPPPPLTALVIRACDRPEQLARLLASLRPHADALDGAPVVVLDDSRLAIAERANAEAIDAASAAGLRISHLSRHRQDQFVDALIAALPDDERSIRWLLTREPGERQFTGGRLWNMAMLLCAGGRMLQFDEDFYLEPRRLSQAPQIRLGHHMALDHLLLAGPDQALEIGTADPINPLAVMVERLAAPLKRSFGGLGADHLQGLAIAELAQLAHGERAASLTFGCYGSALTDSWLWTYVLDQQQQSRLWHGPERYRQSLLALGVYSGSNSVRLLAQPVFTPHGLDLSHLVPPAAPRGRGEDFLFGSLWSLIDPHAAHVLWPSYLGHRHEPGRDAREAPFRPLRPALLRFVADHLDVVRPHFHAASPATRLNFAAAQLTELAEASDSQLSRLLAEYLSYTRAHLIAQLQHQLAQPSEAPDYWRADIAALIEENGRALTAGVDDRLGGIDEFPVEARLRQVRSGLAALARSWESWPRIFDTARQLSREHWLAP